MTDISVLWTALVNELSQQHVALQSFNNPTHKNRKGAIGELVYAHSPIVDLKKNWVHHGAYQMSTAYSWCLQIGSVTHQAYENFNKVLQNIERIIVDSGFDLGKRQDGFIAIEQATQRIVVRFEVSSNYLWIAIRISS